MKKFVRVLEGIAMFIVPGVLTGLLVLLEVYLYLHQEELPGMVVIWFPLLFVSAFAGMFCLIWYPLWIVCGVQAVRDLILGKKEVKN